VILLLEEMKMSSSVTTNIRYIKAHSKNKWKKYGLAIIFVHKDTCSLLTHMCSV